MYSRILVPLDGSKLAEQVLPYAQFLGSRFGSELVILQVASGTNGNESSQVRMAEDYVVGIAHKLKPSGLTVSTKTLVGDASEQISNEARSVESPTLIAMSTCGHSGLDTGKLGRVVEGVLERATNPLMIVRSQPEDAFKEAVQLDTVIVPLDGSLLSEGMLSQVAPLAKALDLKISLVRATPTAGGDETLIMEYPDSQSGERLIDIDADAGDYLQKVGQNLRRQGVKRVDQHVLHSDPAVAIVEFAQLIPHNLVAMTTHGRSGLGPWPLGSVTRLVERHCCTPVLVVRPTDELPVL